MSSAKQQTIRLQKALNAAGLGPLTVDGIKGPATQAALAAYSDRISRQPIGIDVSRWQAKIDWQSVHNGGKAFAIAKASDGYGQDPSFAANWPAMKAAGLLRGAYHWLHPSQDLKKQAQKLFSLVGKLGAGDLPCWIDVERDDKGADGTIGTADDIKATDLIVETFADLVTELTGKRPLVYSYGYYLDDRGIEVPSCGLAIADYRSGPPTVPPGWGGKYTFHQYAGDEGRCIGVNGPCDLDRFNGSLEELKALAGL